MDLLPELIKEYQIAYNTIKQYVGYTYNIGYPIKDKCPKCNYEFNEACVKMLFCSEDDIMGNYFRSRHYTHLCDKCDDDIAQIYSKIYDICVNKSFKIMRSNSQIEEWNCYTFFPIVDIGKPNIIFIMRNDKNSEKNIQLEDILKLNL